MYDAYTVTNSPTLLHDMRLASDSDPIELEWKGPFGWPRVPRNDSLPLLNETPEGKQSGVYLLTFELSRGGHITLWPGHTGRPFVIRLGAHKRAFMKGEYNILDTEQLRLGIRKEKWHGWAEARSQEGQANFAKRKAVIQSDAWELVSGIHLFVTSIQDARLREADRSRHSARTREV